MNTADLPETKLRFDTLYGSLCEVQRALLDNTAKVAGFFLLALGWLATSESARLFLATDSTSRLVTVGSILGVVLLTMFVSAKAYKTSQFLYSELLTLSFLPPAYFQTRRVDGGTFAVYLAGNACLALVLAVVVARLGK